MSRKKNTKIVNYSTLKRIPSILLKNNDTVYLNGYYFKYDFWMYKIKKITFKNIVISEKLINCKDKIRIESIDAENIYFENKANLGGLTIDYDDFETIPKLEFVNYKEYPFKINIINILIKGEKSIIDLRNNIYYINIKLNNNKLEIETKSKQNTIFYFVDKFGNVEEQKRKYRIDETNINSDELNLIPLKDYTNIFFDYLNLEKLIIDKKILKEINLFTDPDALGVYSKSLEDILRFNKINIIDENNMKLIPYNKTFSVSKYNFIKKDKKGIYIKDESNEILLFVDQDNNIIELNKEELEKSENIDNVLFNFRSINGLNPSTLILIEYKDGLKKIIDFDNEYYLTKEFMDFLHTNISYYYNSYGINIYEDKGFSGLFETITNAGFKKVYQGYQSHLNWLSKLKKVGLSEDAIQYITDKKITSITKPQSDNEIDDLMDEEIYYYNKLGETLKKKILKNEE